MRYYKELLIAVLILAVFWSVFDGQLQRKHLTEAEKREELGKAKLDSLQKLHHQADLSAIEWHTKYNVLEAGTKKQGDQLINVIKQNAYLKKTYAPMLPDSVLQREVATLYKGR